MITRERIAEAASDIGLEDLTMKDVADRLGVSVAGLYHHVSGKDELFRLAAEHAAGRVALPTDHGQHWTRWLYEWAVYNRDVFLAQPALLGQYLEGAINAEAIAERADAILGPLLRGGFGIDEAQTAYEIVSTSAIGFAIAVIRERRLSEQGRPTLSEHHRVLADRTVDELPNLRQLIAKRVTEPPAPFEQRMLTIITGIAVEHGTPPEEVREALGSPRRGTGSARS